MSAIPKVYRRCACVVVCGAVVEPRIPDMLLLLLHQISLGFELLTESIKWERSCANIKCRVCRKKSDGAAILLCDGYEASLRHL